jgi:hypothetical protein
VRRQHHVAGDKALTGEIRLASPAARELLPVALTLA